MPLSRTLSLLTSQMHAGLHTGFQLHVTLRNEEVANHAAGIARPDSTPLTPDTLMLWMSAGKPVTAVAIARLWEKGKLDLDDPVVKFIPEFSPHGKDRITLRHCLTHTAGLRGPLNNFTPGPWEAILSRIYNLRPEHPPGTKAAYHAATTWFLLAEIIQRLTQTPYSQYVRDNIFLPLDMPDCYIGMSPETYDTLLPRLASLPHTEDPANPNWDTPPNTKESTLIPRPGANARGPMRQFSRFYQMLLNKGSLTRNSELGTRNSLLSPQTVDALTAPHRVGQLDLSFQHKIDFALGFLTNSNHYNVPTTPYQYGPHASPRTFGHSGNQSSVAFADPDHHLTVSLAFNGLPGEPAHQQRTREALTTLYEELGLATPA